MSERDKTQNSKDQENNGKDMPAPSNEELLTSDSTTQDDQAASLEDTGSLEEQQDSHNAPAPSQDSAKTDREAALPSPAPVEADSHQSNKGADKAIGFFQSNGSISVKRVVVVALTGVLLVLLVIMAVISSLSPPPAMEADPSATVAPTFDGSEYGETGIVYLRNTRDYSLEYVRENLVITPEVEYDILQRGEHFQIHLLSPGNTVYTIHLPDPDTGKDLSITVSKSFMSVRTTSLNLHDHPVDEGIVLEFSEDIYKKELKDCMTVTPPFEFHIEYVEDHIVRIIPNEELLHNWDYTITVGANLRSFDETLTLGTDFTLQLHTQRQEFQVKVTNPGAELLTLSDVLSMEFQTLIDHAEDDSLASQPVQVDFYRFSSMEEYLTRSEILTTSHEVLTELELVDSQVHTLARGLTAWERANPGLGGYLVHATSTNPETGEDYEFRKAFSVTDLSLYAQTNGTQTLLWLNSSVTGQPLEGYEVAFRKRGADDPVVTAVTGSDGVAILDYAEEDPDDNYILQNPANVLSLRDNTGAVVYVDNTRILNYYSSLYNSGSSQRYYAYFHIDRPLYKPTDEIQFWGYIQPYRDNLDPMPTTATIVLGEGTLNQEVEVSIGGDGTFLGSISVENVKSAQYELACKISRTRTTSGPDGEPAGSTFLSTLRSKYLQIKEYEKPAYIIQSEVDREYYLPGEDVTVTVTPTFYDGTPMPYYDLIFTVYTYYYGDESFERTIQTDEDGVATITFPAQQRPLDSNEGWNPVRNRYMARIVDDGENIVLTGSYTYLPTDLYYSGSVTQAGSGEISLDLGTYQIDFSKITPEDPLIAQASTSSSSSRLTTVDEKYDAWRGAPLDMELTISTEYTFYTKNGDRVSRSKTYYSEHAMLEKGHSAPAENRSDTKRETEESVHSYSTLNGRLRIDSLIPEEYDGDGYLSLVVTINGVDSTGRGITGRISWYKGNEYKVYDPETTGPYGYNWRVTNSQGENVLGPYYEWTTYSTASFEPGEPMNFELYYRHDPAPNEGRLLYTILQGKIVERNFTTSNTLQLTQKVDYANSINVVAAYFDGAKVWPVRDVIISLNKENMGLEVELTPEKEGYHPGDTVAVDLLVTDSNGKGVAGNAIVSVVDESLFALQEQHIQVLYDLYDDMYFSHYDVQKYTTTTGDYNERESEGGMGDGGKGGDGDLSFLQNLRRNFRDTAYFYPVRTDADGKASISFSLPDNVTSWRVTGVAIGDNLYAGHSTANFVSTMPFFIKPVVSTKYIAGDDVAILVQGHGAVLDKDSVIDYLVSITGDGVEQTLDAQAKAYDSVQLNFGQLPEGEYTLLATARSGSYNDAIEIKIAVIHSNLELVIHRELDLSQPLDIAAMRYPVTISFYDQAHKSYYNTLSSLLTHYCMTTNQRLARYVAKERLTQNLGAADIPMHIQKEDVDLSGLQNSDGGIGWYKNEPSEVLLSAKTTLAAKDAFSESALRSYFRTVINEHSSGVRKVNSRLTEIQVPDWELVAASYLALAHLEESVTEEILELLDRSDASLHERAYLIAALAYAGEEERARQEYAATFSPLKKNSAYGWYIEADSRDPELSNAVTATAWIAASRLHLEDADLFADYFAARPWRFSTLFEAMIYVSNYDRETGSGSFTYSLGDEIYTTALGPRGQATVVLSKGDMEQFSMAELPSSLAATAYYIGEPGEADFSPTGLFSLEKEIASLGNDRYTVTLTLDFGPEAPVGQYDISEWIPSNTRLYMHNTSNKKKGGNWSCHTITEGQKIYYRVNRRDDTARIQLSYTIQQTFGTPAVLDSTYVIHGDSGENYMTERGIFQPQ